MEVSELISEQQAATLAGVGVSTLNSFIDTGYLRVKETKENVRFFSSAELASLFNIEIRLDHQPVSKITDDNNTFGQPFIEASRQANIENIDTIIDSVEIIQHLESPQPPIAEITPTNHNLNLDLQSEVTRQKRIIELQEEILKIREGQLADIKSENDWLKSRIEKLEARSDREQIIHMADIETIRKLVEDRKGKTSTFRQVLNWLNITQEPAKEISYFSVDKER